MLHMPDLVLLFGIFPLSFFPAATFARVAVPELLDGLFANRSSLNKPLSWQVTFIDLLLLLMQSFTSSSDHSQ